MLGRIQIDVDSLPKAATDKMDVFYCACMGSSSDFLGSQHVVTKQSIDWLSSQLDIVIPNDYLIVVVLQVQSSDYDRKFIDDNLCWPILWEKSLLSDAITHSANVFNHVNSLNWTQVYSCHNFVIVITAFIPKINQRCLFRSCSPCDGSTNQTQFESSQCYCSPISDI